MPQLSTVFQPASVFALRRATTPHRALLLFKTRNRSRNPQDRDFDSHAAVFTLKACSSSAAAGDRPILFSHLHAHLLKAGLFSDAHVAAALLHGYSLFSLALAHRLFEEIPHRNVVTNNTMITCCARHNDLSASRTLFDAMPERDVVSWSAMIGGYMDGGYRSHGLELFRIMMAGEEAKPDQLTLVTVLSGCAGTGSSALLGKSIHAYLEKHAMEINAQLGTSLIHIYMKSGFLMSGFRVFERMPQRNVMHWTAMICGLALHGHGTDALAFFEQMRKQGIKPNEITFTGVLNACCHAGLVYDGQRYFRSMAEEFGLEVGIQHFGCMVDLFAKVGMLENAYGVIQSMKVEPNIVIWTSLLAACKKHGRFDIARKVIDKVLEMVDPDNDGGIYTLISDLYAMVGRWQDVERIRRLMDKNNVKKNRGSTFI